MDLHWNMKKTPKYQEVWKDLKRWVEVYGINLAIECNPGPELIWVGNKYGMNSQRIPRVLFMGYNPR